MPREVTFPPLSPDLVRDAPLWETLLTPLGSLPSAFFRVLQRSPLRRHHLPVSTPGIHVRHAAGPRGRAAVQHSCRRADSWSLRPPAAMRATRSDCAVSHRLAGLLHRRLTGLLHPAANHGVHRVSARGPIANRCRVLPLRCPALQSLPRFHSRADVTVDRCPLDVAGCTPSCGTCRLQGLAPWERPLPSTAVAGV